MDSTRCYGERNRPIALKIDMLQLYGLGKNRAKFWVRSYHTHGVRFVLVFGPPKGPEGKISNGLRSFPDALGVVGLLGGTALGDCYRIW